MAIQNYFFLYFRKLVVFSVSLKQFGAFSCDSNSLVSIVAIISVIVAALATPFGYLRAVT